MHSDQYTILAIDPGYDRCGVAVISVTGKNGTLIYSTCIETSKNNAHQARLAKIYTDVSSIIDLYHPHCLALETLFFSVNKKTALKVSESRGVISLIAGLKNLELIELSPQQVKLSATGAGNTPKDAVKRMVELILKIKTDAMKDDEIDAIALGFAAIGHLAHQRL